MSWNAKLTYGYLIDSAQGNENIEQMNIFFNAKGYTLEAQAGIIGNVNAESGLNPWRWQSETAGTQASKGYGLFQFTPAYGYSSAGGYVPGYITDCKDLDWYAPNLNTNVQTMSALPSDGFAQLEAFDTDKLNKWTHTWVSNWGEANHIRWLALKYFYGDSSGFITLDKFKTINNISDATFIFLTHFERPAVLNTADRENAAKQIYPLLKADTPPMPSPPSGKVKKKKMPIYFYLKHF